MLELQHVVDMARACSRMCLLGVDATLDGLATCARCALCPASGIVPLIIMACLIRCFVLCVSSE